MIVKDCEKTVKKEEMSLSITGNIALDAIRSRQEEEGQKQGSCCKAVAKALKSL